jgi:carboxyl-terminal processing protease
MKRDFVLLLTRLVLLSIFLSACAGLPTGEAPADTEFGPRYSMQEHQRRTFNALWGHLQDDYIYFETEDLEWDSIRARYESSIDQGLSSEEFIALLEGLESELPGNGLIYQSRTERIETNIADLSTFEGVGMFVSFEAEPNPHLIVLDVIDGSPAESAGLQAHDNILAIDGEPVQLEEGVTAVDRIRGPAGSAISLSVQTPGQPTRIIKVTRAQLTRTAALKSGIIPGTDYGYILFPPVGYEGLLEDVLASMQAMTTNRKLAGLILDLRIVNTSGTWPLEQLLTLFQNGVVGEFYNRRESQLFRIQGQDVLDSQSVPLVVLTGKNTSGFPEILAAGLQKSRRAVIIGVPTPGNIETITSYYLPDGSHVHIQSTSFRLLTGIDIGLVGIEPDLLIETGWDEILPESDPLIDAAVALFDEADQ